jgi:hypothetical protein
MSKDLGSCGLHKGIAARDQIPNGLAAKGRGPKLTGAHADVQGRAGFAARSVSIMINADCLRAGGGGPDCVSEIAVRRPTGDQGVSFEVQYFATTIADLVCAPSVGETQQLRYFFKSFLPTSGELFDQGRIPGDVNKQDGCRKFNGRRKVTAKPVKLPEQLQRQEALKQSTGLFHSLFPHRRARKWSKEGLTSQYCALTMTGARNRLILSNFRVNSSNTFCATSLTLPDARLGVDANQEPDIWLDAVFR